MIWNVIVSICDAIFIATVVGFLIFWASEYFQQKRGATREQANGSDHTPMVVEKATSNGADGEIDESLYSRQLYVLGAEAMKKMSKSSVLIAGIGAVGVEAAKNIILGGVKKVTLWDNQGATWTDLGGQFYLTEGHVKQSTKRAAASFEQLKELNPYVAVELLESEELSEQAIAEHNVLLVTDSVKLMNADESKLLALGDTCRKNDTSLIIADVAGLAGRLFCDFGDKFIVNDKDGSEPKSV